MTLDEMRKQRQELDKAIKVEEARIRAERQEEVVRKIEAMSDEDKATILKYMPHDRSSCDESKLGNGYSDYYKRSWCRKCHLMQILNGDWGGRFDFNITADIWEVQ